MWDEIVVAWRMTPRDAFKWPPKKTKSWTDDKHLRNGFFLGLPVFLVPTFLAKSNIPSGILQFAVMFTGSIAANVVWLTYAAWSRERDQEQRSD
jgi:hypothetical protein